MSLFQALPPFFFVLQWFFFTISTQSKGKKGKRRRFLATSSYIRWVTTTENPLLNVKSVWSPTNYYFNH